MKYVTRRTILLCLGLALLLLACDALQPPNRPGFSDDDDLETWAFLPFYGETRFQILDAHSQTPIPGALLVSNLRLEELADQDALPADESGLIVVHQLL